MTFYLALVDEGTPFDPGVHHVEDFSILSFNLSQQEGDFASLEIEIKNPRVGLLAPGRKRWCWFSWDGGGSPEDPLFQGELVGVPQDLHGPTVTLLFRAQPTDYATLKQALADTLRVLPWYDTIWDASGTDDADTVLEGRSALWHTDRATLEVSISDILNGEAGTIEFGAGDHTYDGQGLTYDQAPLTQVTVTGTVTWTQAGSGEIDLTRRVWNLFRDGINIYAYPTISTLTGDGFKSDWPEPGRVLGGGWSIGQTGSLDEVTYVQQLQYNVKYFGVYVDPNNPVLPQILWTNAAVEWEAVFPVSTFKLNVPMDWTAARKRTETVTFTLSADMQELLTQPTGLDDGTLEFSSDYVDQAVDPGSPMALPIGDVTRNSYFKTDRGQQSLWNLIERARALLLSRARAVSVKFTTPFDRSAGITLRHNAHIVDSRLPGGEATGKVIAYSLIFDDQGPRGEITIGCTIGRGNSVTTAVDGTGVYAEPGYMQRGYQVETGTAVLMESGDVTVQSLDDFTVTDDGVDLANVETTAISSITLTNSLGDQVFTVTGTPRAGIDPSLTLAAQSNPIGALSQMPTMVCFNLKPLDGEFSTTFTPTVSQLMVPKSIDLEATSGSP